MTTSQKAEFTAPLMAFLTNQAAIAELQKQQDVLIRAMADTCGIAAPYPPK
jgi:hypothetical protein